MHARRAVINGCVECRWCVKNSRFSTSIWSITKWSRVITIWTVCYSLSHVNRQPSMRCKQYSLMNGTDTYQWTITNGVLRPKNELAKTILAVILVVKLNLLRLCSEKTIFKRFIHEYAENQLSVWFLSRVRILTRDIDIANLSVRLSVRPSVRYVPVSDENGLTYRHSFVTITLVLPASNIFTKFLRGQPCMGTKYRWGIKISRFSTNKSLYLANDTRYRHSYYGRRIGNRT